jgi:hypothetical protein
MKNNIKKTEPVEVMALFGYEMTPCQPLSFKRKGDRGETEVTELLGTTIKFVGTATHHFFDVLAGRKRYHLEFDSLKLHWYLSEA